MPELPDVELYRSHLERRFVGQKLVGLRLASPFVLRTYAPKPEALVGKSLVGVERLGKRIVFVFEGDFFLVVHLMISGRFRLRDAGTKPPGKLGLAAIDFPSHTVLLTEASTHKRASLHVIQGREALRAMDPGGLEPLEVDYSSFRTRLLEGNHTLKRALTDPRHFSGIGNAYSDELLHAAKLSPIRVVSKLAEDEIVRLYDAMRRTLEDWAARLAVESKDEFPEKVTAFRPDMAVHGKYGAPCPVCGTKVQRIRYANNEANYCPACQTEGKLLADRALSRLLGKEWPKSLEELELHKELRLQNPRPAPLPPPDEKSLVSSLVSTPPGSGAKRIPRVSSPEPAPASRKVGPRRASLPASEPPRAPEPSESPATIETTPPATAPIPLKAVVPSPRPRSSSSRRRPGT